jgi:hypothetical protein
VSSDTEPTPFGQPEPETAGPPPLAIPPPPVPVLPADPPLSSPLAVTDPPTARPTLGDDWSFGATSGTPSVRLPSSRRSIALAVAVFLVAAAGTYFVLNRGGSGGSAFALSLNQGESYTYMLSMTFNGSASAAGQEVPFSLIGSETFTWKVDSVDANGVATITMSFQGVSSTINGQRAPQAIPDPIQIQVAKDGRILTAGNLAFAGGTDAGPAFLGADQITPLLPDHPVKPGDTWTKSFDQEFPFGGGKLHYESRNEYLRDENVDGVTTAVIATRMDIPLDLTVNMDKVLAVAGESDPSIPKGAKMIFSGSMNFTQTSWFDRAHGSLVKGSIAGTMDMSFEFKGLPQSPGFPNGKLGFKGDMTIQIQQAPAPGSIKAEPTAQDKKAQADLRSALAAIKVAVVEAGSYQAVSPKSLHAVVPSLQFDTDSKAHKGVISIRAASNDSILLVTRSASGQIYCLADSATAGVSYGTKDARNVKDCAGGW